MERICRRNKAKDPRRKSKGRIDLSWFGALRGRGDFWNSFDYWLAERNRPLPRSFAQYGGAAPRAEYFLSGSIRLPNRACVGDSTIVNLELLPEFTEGETPHPDNALSKDKEGNLAISVKWNDRGQLLLIRLIGVGIEVSPVTPEKIEFKRGGAISFAWGCSFTKSGNHMLALRCSGSEESDGSLGYQRTGINHRVKVVQVDGLTLRQVKIWSALLTILSSFRALSRC
jgi:hypothetical protein